MDSDKNYLFPHSTLRTPIYIIYIFLTKGVFTYDIKLMEEQQRSMCVYILQQKTQCVAGQVQCCVRASVSQKSCG